jgi:hypothetical protein
MLYLYLFYIIHFMKFKNIIELISIYIYFHFHFNILNISPIK